MDTTGAGDAFAVYVIGMTSKGASVEEALDMAQMAAAISVTRKGATDQYLRSMRLLGMKSFGFHKLPRLLRRIGNICYNWNIQTEIKNLQM